MVGLGADQQPIRVIPVPACFDCFSCLAKGSESHQMPDAASQFATAATARSAMMGQGRNQAVPEIGLGRMVYPKSIPPQDRKSPSNEPVVTGSNDTRMLSQQAP